MYSRSTSQIVILSLFHIKIQPYFVDLLASILAATRRPVQVPKYNCAALLHVHCCYTWRCCTRATCVGNW
jgi:hypothetical protein